MTKEDAVKLLCEKGYPAVYKDGMVLIETENQADFGKIGRVLKKTGYNESYGWRKANAEKQEAETDRKDHKELGNI